MTFLFRGPIIDMKDFKLKPLNYKIGGQVCASHACSEVAACQHNESLEISVSSYGMSLSVLMSAERRAISRHSNRLMNFLSLDGSRSESGDATGMQK